MVLKKCFLIHGYQYNEFPNINTTVVACDTVGRKHGSVVSLNIDNVRLITTFVIQKTMSTRTRKCIPL